MWSCSFRSSYNPQIFASISDVMGSMVEGESDRLPEKCKTKSIRERGMVVRHTLSHIVVNIEILLWCELLCIRLSLTICFPRASMILAKNRTKNPHHQVDSPQIP
jgi:hypothetical protein